MSEFGIYRIRNIINNKCYIGSSIDIRRRFYEHKHKLKFNKHPSYYLQRSYNKYKKENFTYEVIEILDDFNKLIEREQYYIDTLNPEYNLCRKAGNTLGFKHSEETKKKFREHHAKVKTKPPLREFKAVIQCDLNGNYIKEYNSIIEASKLTNSLPSGICHNCKGKIKSHKGFIWKYKI